ncbi:MAG: hypothetical protein HWD61_06720 [Parachlamydiaceae bacterium]|nr:MAG: hypothetical protein HWD61_06720 [Parachlamydiaceae bacterium]
MSFNIGVRKIDPFNSQNSEFQFTVINGSNSNTDQVSGSSQNQTNKQLIESISPVSSQTEKEPTHNEIMKIFLRFQQQQDELEKTSKCTRK